jgi:hypothetical protein
MAMFVRFATGLAMVAFVGFGYVAWHEWRFWADHDHNGLAGVLAVAGAAGVALALAVVVLTFVYDEDKL